MRTQRGTRALGPWRDGGSAAVLPPGPVGAGPPVAAIGIV
jgi:hypothetical protein